MFLSGADWAQFRGPQGSGVSQDQNLPVVWNEKENIAWKVDLPGKGISGPIVVGNRVIVTACSGYQQDRLHVLCFAADTGKKTWERQFWATGRTMCHNKMSVAAPTPASDGERIFAFYSTNDVICLDLEGNLQWFRGLTFDYPNASNSLGMASSPIVVGDTLVVQAENDSESFAAGLDVKTGKNRWKLDRPILANWTSPTILPGKTRDEDLVLLQSGRGLSAVRPRTGESVWKYGEGCSTIPSSVVADGVVYAPSNGMVALRAEAGDSSPKVLWSASKLSPKTPSPLVYRDHVYCVGSADVLSCASAKTGEVVWKLRLEGPFSGTPVAAEGRLYLFNERGVAQVVQLGEKGEIVATNDLKETILCTPAIARNAIFVRSDTHLWKIAKPAATARATRDTGVTK